MNIALINTLKKNRKINGKAYLDCYNQVVYYEYSPTITTRVNDRCQDLIYEDEAQINNGPIGSGDARIDDKLQGQCDI